MAEIIDWPGQLPATLEVKLASKRKQFTSPFNNATQVVAAPGSAWLFNVTFQNLDDEESATLESLIVRLDQGGRVKIPDFGRISRFTVNGPTVDVAAQTGVVLTTANWNPGDTLKRGDYFTVNNELKFVTQDSTADGLGKMTVHFGPQLRNAPLAATPLELVKPFGLFRLVEDENGVSREPAFNNNITLNFREAFY